MLILSRRGGESLIIGNDIIVTVLGSKSGQVRLGVTAPLDIGVFREEIYQRIESESGRDGHEPITASAPSKHGSRLSLRNSGEK